MRYGAITKGHEVRVGGEEGATGLVGWLGPGKFGGVRAGIDRQGQQRQWVSLDELAPMAGWTEAHAAALTGDQDAIAGLEPSELDARTEEAIELQLGSSARSRHRLAAGSTPLHVALVVPDPAMVRALLAAGARCDVPDERGELPGLDLVRVHANEIADTVAEIASLQPLAEALALAAVRRGNGHVLMGLARGGFDFEAPLGDGASLRKRFVAEVAWGPKRKAILAAARRQESPDVVQPAPTGKTKCKDCGKKIGRGEPQFGKGEERPDGRVRRTWYHLECAERLFGPIPK